MFDPIGSPVVILAGGLLAGLISPPVAAGVHSIYDFTMKTIDGKEVSLGRYRGKVLLVVNVASKCGNTPQYAELETLYKKYGKDGFMILGFPANNFLGQEPGTDEEIKTFCTVNYGVTFDLYSKISVKGKDQHPLYAYLTSAEANPATEGGVTWNFQKYLVGRDGTVLAKFTPKTKPLSDEVTVAVEKALAAK